MKNKLNNIKILFFIIIPSIYIIFWCSVIPANFYNLDNINFNFFLAVSFYFVSHIFRLFRFSLISKSLLKLKFRTILFCYLNSSIFILIMPFKLGELVKVCNLNYFSGDFFKSFSVVLLEKSADSIFLILSICLILSHFGYDLFYVISIIILVMIIFILIFVIIILYPILASIHSYVFINHNSPVSILIQKAVFTVLMGIKDLNICLNKAFVPVLAISVFIYFFEFLTIYFVLNGSLDLIIGNLKTNISYSYIPLHATSIVDYKILLVWFCVLLIFWIIAISIIISSFKTTRYDDFINLSYDEKK